MSKAGKRERQKENRERAREERERLMKRDRRMKTMRSLLFVLVPIMVILVIISVTSSSNDSSSKYYTATIETSEGNIVIALDHNTPTATDAFVKLAQQKKYDGLCIDRIARDFVIQGGSPKCDQQGNLMSPVVGEVPKNHYPVGSLAAAKTGSDPAGTFAGQFFIVTGSQGATLPNDYARFGTVSQGLDVAEKIGNLPIQNGASDGKPVTKITINKITVTSSKKAPATTTTTKAATSSTT